MYVRGIWHYHNEVALKTRHILIDRVGHHPVHERCTIPDINHVPLLCNLRIHAPSLDRFTRDQRGVIHLLLFLLFIQVLEVKANNFCSLFHILMPSFLTLEDNMDPAMIENAMAKHPAVALATVVGA